MEKLPLSYVDKELHTIDDWRLKFNRLRDNVNYFISFYGDTTLLLPRSFDEETQEILVPDNIVAALIFSKNEKLENELNSFASTDSATHLDFSDYSSIVEYLNGAKLDFEKISGELDNLTPDERTNIVASLNWVIDQLGSNSFDGDTFVGLLNVLSSKLGDITNNPASLASSVALINLIITKIGGIDLTALRTTNKVDLIAALNSTLDMIDVALDNREAVRVTFDGFDDDKSETLIVKLNNTWREAGELDRLLTVFKDTWVGAINEIHDEVGTPTELNTDKKDTIVDAISEKKQWQIYKNNPEKIYYNDDVHILNDGDVLIIDEEYDFWKEQGYLETYKVWVKSSEKRKYREWLDQSYTQKYKVKKPSGYWKNVTTKTPIYSWSKIKVGQNIKVTTKNFYNPAIAPRVGHAPHIAHHCLAPSSFGVLRDKWWKAHLANKWTGPLGNGGYGWGKHKGHFIGISVGGHCSWTTKLVKRVRYVYNTTKKWVDTSTYVTKTRVVNKGTWVTKTKVVDTSHWENRKRWIDTSTWVKKTRRVPQPDLPEIGLYIDGNVKGTTFKAGGTAAERKQTIKINGDRVRAYVDLEGTVTGNVTGTVTGNASGTANGWTRGKLFSLTGEIEGDATIQGTTNKSINISNQTNFSKKVHNHDDRNYWKIGETKQLYLAQSTSSLTEAGAWAYATTTAGTAIVNSWEVGQLVVVITAGKDYVWMKSNVGWFKLSESQYNQYVAT